MNNYFIDFNIFKNFVFNEVEKSKDNYQYYIDAKKDLKEQVDIDDIMNIIDNSLLKDTYLEQMKDFDINILYKSNIHGINHNIRVCFFAFVISSFENISISDFKIIMEACKYHDIGRINDFEDREHGKRSSEMIIFLKDKYIEEDINCLKTIIACHSMNDSEFESIAIQNGIDDIDRCKKMYEILKDSDGLDRVRLEYPVIKVNYLRTRIAKRMILFAYNLFNNYDKLIK